MKAFLNVSNIIGIALLIFNAYFSAEGFMTKGLSYQPVVSGLTALLVFYFLAKDYVKGTQTY